jgi:hypothetical protein
VLIIVAVWWVLKLYDEPARRWLKARLRPRLNSGA